MNKKVIIIASVVVLVLLSLLSVFIYFMSKNNAPVTGVAISTSTVETEATLENTKPPVAEKIDDKLNETINSDIQTSEKVDNFPWLRKVFLSSNNDSQKIQTYLNTTVDTAGIIVASCDTVNNINCLKEFQEIAQSCGLSADAQINLPLAYDNDKSVCYQGYDEIVSYLNDEIQTNQDVLRTRNGN